MMTRLSLALILVLIISETKAQEVSISIKTARAFDEFIVMDERNIIHEANTGGGFLGVMARYQFSDHLSVETGVTKKRYEMRFVSVVNNGGPGARAFDAILFPLRLSSTHQLRKNLFLVLSLGYAKAIVTHDPDNGRGSGGQGGRLGEFELTYDYRYTPALTKDFSQIDGSLGVEAKLPGYERLAIGAEFGYAKGFQRVKEFRVIYQYKDEPEGAALLRGYGSYAWLGVYMRYSLLGKGGTE